MIKNVRYNSDVRNTKNRVTLSHTKKNHDFKPFLMHFECACPQNANVTLSHFR